MHGVLLKHVRRNPSGEDRHIQAIFLGCAPPQQKQIEDQKTFEPIRSRIIRPFDGKGYISVKEVHIRIPSHTEFVGPVVKFLYDLFSNKEIPEATVSHIITSVSESVGNAIVHGNKCDHRKQVDIRLLIHQNTLTIAVHDEGEGFEVSSLPDPLSPENLLNPCGRGIFLIKHFMEDVSFHFDRSGATVQFKKTFEYDIETAG